MVTFPHDCPHCGTKNSGFEVLSNYRGLDISDEIKAWFLRCSNYDCMGPAVMVIPHSNSDPSIPYAGHPTAFYPAPPKPSIPGYLPPNVESPYREAEDIYKQAPNAAGAMYRKALDVGLKLKFPDFQGNLAPRIKKLVEKGALTKDLGDLAHQVRLGGNDAAHDDEPLTLEEVKELRFLARMILTYVISLPEMIRERQAKIGKAKEG